MNINDMGKGGKNTSTGVERTTKTITTFPVLRVATAAPQ